MQVRTSASSSQRWFAATLAACGSSSPVEVIVKPGITAIEQSSALACDADRMTLETAIETFTLLNAAPPTAESDLVPDWLSSESALYDLVDGQIVPAPDSGCPRRPPADAAPQRGRRPAVHDRRRGTVPVDEATVRRSSTKVLEVCDGRLLHVDRIASGQRSRTSLPEYLRHRDHAATTSSTAPSSPPPPPPASNADRPAATRATALDAAAGPILDRPIRTVSPQIRPRRTPETRCDFPDRTIYRTDVGAAIRTVRGMLDVGCDDGDATSERHGADDLPVRPPGGAGGSRPDRPLSS